MQRLQLHANKLPLATLKTHPLHRESMVATLVFFMRVLEFSAPGGDGRVAPGPALFVDVLQREVGGEAPLRRPGETRSPQAPTFHTTPGVVPVKLAAAGMKSTAQ